MWKMLGARRTPARRRQRRGQEAVLAAQRPELVERRDERDQVDQADATLEHQPGGPIARFVEVHTADRGRVPSPPQVPAERADQSGSDRGSPNRGRTLFSKRVTAQI